MSNKLKDMRRDFYTNVKKMSILEIQKRLNILEKVIREEVRAEIMDVYIEDIENTIRNTKGIGTVKYGAIKSELDKLFEKGRE